MLFYATTESERASKGQGGNKKLLTIFQAETSEGRIEIGRVEMYQDENKLFVSSTMPKNKKYKKGEKR